MSQALAPVAVVGLDGQCTLRAVSAAALAAATEEVEAAAEDIRGYASRLLLDAATMRLAVARERVPPFGDWAYGWVQSYVTSYRVLARGAMGMVDSVAGRGKVPGIAQIADEMAAPIREEFRYRVLAPSMEDGSFAADLDHVSAMVDQAWLRALRVMEARLAALPATAAPADTTVPQGGTLPRLDLMAAARPMRSEFAGALPVEPMALTSEEEGDNTTVFLRSMRPMAARLGAVLVRISEAGSLVATGGAFGYALAGLPGTAIGLAGGIGLSWSIDWMFNKVDASLNRHAFEAQALAALDRVEQRVTRDGRAAADAAIAIRLAALRAPGGCP
jgi:hypothetical protein